MPDLEDLDHLRLVIYRVDDPVRALAPIVAELEPTFQLVAETMTRAIASMFFKTD
jgi:hypothetical protein